MDVAVPPVIRGDFVYRDTLFVDVGGEGKLHPRASESELKALLKGTSQKDQVAHWYEAQLTHYGLQRSKEKNTAKVRLQQALSQGKLKVPPLIADMESQMKKEYASAVRKAKAQGKSHSTDGSNQSAAKGKKRANDESESSTSKRTKISMNVGDISINIEHGASQVVKKVSTAKPSSPSSKASPSITKKEGFPSKAKASQSSTKAGAKTSKKKSEPTTSAPMPSQKSNQPHVNPRLETKAESSAPSSKAKREKSEPKVKSEAKVKNEPKIKAEPKIKGAPQTKPGPKVKQEETQDEGLRPRNVTGVYDLICPQLEEQLPDYSGRLRMFMCVDNENDRIWAGFELAMKSGVIRIDGMDLDRELSFGWRAKDNWEGGKLSFGRGCFGSIELSAPNKIRGRFCNLFNEDMRFEGRRRAGPLWCGRSAYSFQQEWDGFVAEAYGR